MATIKQYVDIQNRKVGVQPQNVAFIRESSPTATEIIFAAMDPNGNPESVIVKTPFATVVTDLTF